MNRTLIKALFVLCVLVSGCVRLDFFLFDGQPAPAEGYDFSSEALDGIDPERITTEMVEVSNSGQHIYVVFVERDIERLDPRIDADDGVTVIFSYGNRENIAHYWHRAGYLENLGFNVLMYDYRGYGASEGEASEANAFQDLATVYDYATQQESVGEIVSMGFSMGGGPAIWLCSPESEREVLACITDSTMASVDFLFDEGFDLDFEGSFVLDAEFDNTTRAATVEIPFLITHGTLAERVSLVHGEALWNALRNGNELNRYFWVEGAGHRTVPVPSYTFDVEPKEYSYPDEMPPDFRQELEIYQSRIVEFLVDALEAR